MVWFLVFYYFFSLLFMIGYVDFDEIDGVPMLILGMIAMLILSPIMFPLNIGDAVNKIK